MQAKCGSCITLNHSINIKDPRRRLIVNEASARKSHGDAFKTYVLWKKGKN